MLGNWTRLTGRFLAESRKTTSSAEDRPSLAWPRTALMLISAWDGGSKNTKILKDSLVLGGKSSDVSRRTLWRNHSFRTSSILSGVDSGDSHSSRRWSFPDATSSSINHCGHREGSRDSEHSGFFSSSHSTNIDTMIFKKLMSLKGLI